LEIKKVRGFENYYVSKNGDVFSTWHGTMKKMTLQLHKSGYYSIRLSRGLRDYQGFMVHRLVAEAFIENPEDLPTVNHKNGIKTDNRVENLEWMTYKENNRHAWDIGLCDGRRGVNNHFSKISEGDVRTICELLQEGKQSRQEIADCVGVKYNIVSSIVERRDWAHISQDYDIPKPRKIAKKTSDDVAIEVCKLLNQGVRNKDICKKLQVNAGFVTSIKIGRRYKHISKIYLH
tara:strand:- start:58701 stop:59399 length:699 start_codon:yes stop_codon:yes gene_type:complete